VDTPEADLRALALPVGVICGDEDVYNGSAQALAGLLPNAQFSEIPGTHMSCVTKRDLGVAIREFLMADDPGDH
jgi:pimeloyl-ACP methyl ester carboxylesterase